MAWSKKSAKALKRGNAVVGGRVVLTDGTDEIEYIYGRDPSQPLDEFKTMVRGEIAAWINHHDNSTITEGADI